MTRKDNSIVTPASRSGRRTRNPRRDQREPDPAPVVIVRAASVPATPLTPAQRTRRARARWRAAAVTDAARRGSPAPYDPALCPPILAIPEAARIVREAPVIAVAPPAGAVEVGRDRRGRPIAVALHAETWSLVIHPTGDRNQPAASYAYLDEYGADDGSGHLDFCFDTDCTVAGVEWSDMIAAVLAATI